MKQDLSSLIEALAAQIKPQPNTVLIGIHTGGAWLAAAIAKHFDSAYPTGFLDINFYRDDFTQKGLNPQVRASQIDFSIEDKRVILIDDVLFTGRTIRAALIELFEYGRPSCVELAVLFERDGRQLPIAANYVAKKLHLKPNQYVKIKGPSPLSYEIKP